MQTPDPQASNNKNSGTVWHNRHSTACILVGSQHLGTVKLHGLVLEQRRPPHKKARSATIISTHPFKRVCSVQHGAGIRNTERHHISRSSWGSGYRRSHHRGTDGCPNSGSSHQRGSNNDFVVHIFTMRHAKHGDRRQLSGRVLISTATPASR